jgi:hypothetical protein
MALVFPFYLFNASCDKKELQSRLDTTHRVMGPKTKLAIPEVLDDMLNEAQARRICSWTDGRDTDSCKFHVRA